VRVSASFSCLPVHSTIRGRLWPKKKNLTPRRLRFVPLPLPQHPSKEKRLTPRRLRFVPIGRRAPGCRQLPLCCLPSTDPLHLLPFPRRVPGGLLGRRRDRLREAEVPALAPRRPRLLRRPSSSRRRYFKPRSLASTSTSASAPGSRGGVAGRLPRLGLSLACCDSAAARLPGAPSSRSLASIRARHSPTPVATASWSYVLRLGVRAVPVAVHVRTADRQREQRPGVRAGPASGARRIGSSARIRRRRCRLHHDVTWAHPR